MKVYLCGPINGCTDAEAMMPRSKQARALVMIDRIESHAAAHRWNPEAGAGHNEELFG